MWIYSTDKSKLEAANTAIDYALGYPTATATTWATIIESDNNTYLMPISEFTKQYLTSEQISLIVDDAPSEFIHEE